MIYLDNAATTRIDPEVLDAMLPYLKEQYGNAGTIYSIGRSAKKAVEKAREQVASFINARPDNIVFTSGGTESNNIVMASVPKILYSRRRRALAISSVEHASVINPASIYTFRTIPVNPDGKVDMQTIDELTQDADVGMISVMAMNNETGAINNVEAIGEMCKNRGVVFHTDCVQAAGMINLDVNAFCCDFLSLSSHKIHGPKGVGALYVVGDELIDPIILGGNLQERGLRGGTENVAGIVGFGKACEIASMELKRHQVRVSTLLQIFLTELRAALRAHGLDDLLHINGDLNYNDGSVFGKTVSIRFDHIDGETLLLMLDAKGVCVSAGSACHTGESTPSHVLVAMKISPEDARNSIRISLSKMNSTQDVVDAARIIADSVSIISRMKA